MTNNYFLEYRLIPGLFDQVKTGKNPLQSLVDSRWIIACLSSNNIEIDTERFSIDIYDESYNKSTLEKGKYIAYTFPEITSVPEAKYGVIDIEAKKYYTFESDFSKGCWVIGNQEVGSHALVEMVQKDMSLEEFMRYLNQPKTPLGVNKRSGCLSVIVFIITVVGSLAFVI